MSKTDELIERAARDTAGGLIEFKRALGARDPEAASAALDRLWSAARELSDFLDRAKELGLFAESASS
jgi:hypothetical protein